MGVHFWIECGVFEGKRDLEKERRSGEEIKRVWDCIGG